MQLRARRGAAAEREGHAFTRLQHASAFSLRYGSQFARHDDAPCRDACGVMPPCEEDR